MREEGDYKNDPITGDKAEAPRMDPSNPNYRGGMGGDDM